MKSLQALAEKQPKEWPTLKLLKNRIDENNEYQGVPIEPDFDTLLDRCTADSLADLHRLEKNIFSGPICCGLHYLYLSCSSGG